jgi:hypothetical protein
MLGTLSVESRTAIAAGALSPLAKSLAEDLDRFLPDEDFFIPVEKARMTKKGGRCEHDGQFLEFDPLSPRRHRCPACGSSFDAEEHYRWWIMGYQLWLAERAVHAAALGRLTGNERHKHLAGAILDRLADRYLTYPNVDNVLGPGRVFFSTYLESIWTLQLCVALWLYEGGQDEKTATGDRVRDRIIEPSSRLVFSFNEGLSNRQVWNCAMMAASGIALGGVPNYIDHALLGSGGLEYLLRNGLLADGSWYEGENYHLFAHRGFWYLVMLAEYSGITIPADLQRRFDAGFVAPLRTALPDFTFPSRRDSQYRASLRQWRIAESFELGLSRTGAAELSVGLDALYRSGPDGDAARWRSTAEAERNVPGVRLTRADLGWKSLLFARTELPNVPSGGTRSALLESQGLGVIRRDEGRIYVALDYGHSGGSHGHPDRLNIWLVNGDERVFEDVGTGSYVERTLHWYRSTLAHNAPLVDGRSQERVAGTLRAWDERDGYAWIDAQAAVGPHTLVRRSVVVADGYIVDRVEWSGNREVTFDLPMHVDAELEGAEWRSGRLTGASGLEDGFDFVENAESSDGRDQTARIRSSGARGAVSANTPHEWWRAIAPGPPGSGARRFLLVRARGERGRIDSVWSWKGPVDLQVAGDTLAVTLGNQLETHRSVDGTWEIRARNATTTLDGRIPVITVHGAIVRPQSFVSRHTVVPVVRRPISVGDLEKLGRGWRTELGEEHYRRTESSWKEAGSPSATVIIAATDEDLLVETSVSNAEPNFAASAIDNPLDNEHADTNSDGMQIHLTWLGAGATQRTASWLLVPEPGERVRIHERDDAVELSLKASWRQINTGWQLLARIPRATLGPPGDPLAIDVIVNEMPAARERRRGQLVLSGGKGDWAYLRGDRQDRAALIPITFEHD